jgi:hypothetical protein
MFVRLFASSHEAGRESSSTTRLCCLGQLKRFQGSMVPELPCLQMWMLHGAVLATASDELTGMSSNAISADNAIEEGKSKVQECRTSQVRICDRLEKTLFA